MLLDQELLDAIEMKLNKKRSLFNIQVLLQALQLVTRPLNYPNYEHEIDDSFYLHKIKQKLDEAKVSSNKTRYTYLFNDVLPQLTFCCYYINLIRYELNIDKKLLKMLEQVVDNRLYTSAEEQCAEKTLLRMLINRPQEIMLLYSDHQGNLSYSLIQQDIVQRIGFLKGIHEQVAPDNANTKATIKIFAEATTATDRLNDLGQKLREYLSSFSLTMNDNQTPLLITKYSYFGQSMEIARPESSDSVIIDEYFADDDCCDELQPLKCLSSR